MKLIIDIPQIAYDTIQTLKDIEDTNEGTLENILIKAIENSIPLNKISKKIEQLLNKIPIYTSYEHGCYCDGKIDAYEDVLDIIDGI